MDDVDRAQAEERLVETSINNVRHRAAHRELLPVGSCYYCQSAVASGYLFCNSECRDDWEQEKAARARSGMVR